MAVVTPDRSREAPPAPPAPPPPAPPRRGIPWGLVGLGVVVLLGLLVPGWISGLLPSIPNPFAEKTVDRSGAAVLRSVRGLQELHAATGHFEVVVDLEQDTALPAAVLGERTLFVGVGDVDALVDLSQLGEDAVAVSGDRRSATLVLPQPRLGDPRLDLEASHVYDRRQGVLNELGDLFGGNETSEREVYLAAQRKIGAAAQSSPELRRAARDSARRTLRALLTSLGFERVTIRYAAVEP